MRRRTTILDVLREDRRHASEAASSTEVDDSSSNAVDHAPEAPARSRRRGRGRDEDVESEAMPAATPDADTLRRRLETRGNGRRRTLASGRRRGLVMADWLQSDFVVPRGYVVAAGLFLLLGLWGIFMLGRMNGRASVSPVAKMGSGSSDSPQTMHEGGWSDAALKKGDRDVSPTIDVKPEGVAAFQIVTYAPIEANKAYIRAMVDHLKAELGGDVEAKAFTRTDSDGAASYVVAVLLPESAVGDGVEADRLFQRLRALKAPTEVRFDFSKLQRSEIPYRELPEAPPSKKSP